MVYFFIYLRFISANNIASNAQSALAAAQQAG